MLLSLPDQLKALILSKMKSTKILDILKMYPKMRKVFRKYRKLIPLNFDDLDITNKDLKYLKGVHTISLYHSDKITNQGLKYLKGVHAIDLNSCCQITDVGLKYLKGVRIIYLSHCDRITDRGLEYLKGVEIIDLSYCHEITEKGILCLKNANDKVTIDM